MSQQPESIAIVGMAGRFPMAGDIDAFWDNVRSGRECITFFNEQELQPMGIEFPKPDARFIKARGLLENADLFDAAFFGINPREAEVLDPQQRLFLECAWEALEDAGYDPEREERLIGVFGGATFNTYLVNILLSRPDLLELFSAYQLMLANDKDFLTTRVSYKLNLRGPSLNVQTACSTSLVAVSVACQNLLTFQCDFALAGCVSVTFPQKQIHLYQGGIASPDGKCRVFDAKAQGTVPGEGVGIVVLKRLSDAIADGDHLYAVIRGFAMNNDGALKAGYTAPSENGQAEVIAWAQAMAGIDPATIGYMEAHGTGTPLGDPIEIAGLTRAFRAGTNAKNFCAIGSIKSAIGHLDVAAGMAGLINATLALHHRTLPPSLNFETPNPKIDFANSPFYVNTQAREWKATGSPRRAGVSSFGIGSTNVHVVLEEAPAIQPSSPSRPAQLLLLSAKTPGALKAAAGNLAEFLARHPETNLADAAYTLQVGRRHFAHRRAVVCRDAGEAIEALRASSASNVSSRAVEPADLGVAFMFPGQGSQKAGMGRELYGTEPLFRNTMDRCAEILRPLLELDIRDVIGIGAQSVPDSESRRAEASRSDLKATWITQPALFMIEYALARLWMSWGIQPKAMIGHSVGEYVAACIAGVFSLEDGLKLVATRGRMMQELPGGAMLAVRLPEAEIQSVLGPEVSLAAVNGARQCVVSGPQEAINALEQQLKAQGIAAHPLQTSHAFHSPMVDAALPKFTGVVKQVKLSPPRVPLMSNLTGTWMTEGQATDPNYWAQHMRRAVRFAEGAGELLRKTRFALLEAGPGNTLAALVRQHPDKPADRLVLSSLPAGDSTADNEAILSALGQLWAHGATIDWTAFYAGQRRHRVRLPAYPFERKRFWIEPGSLKAAATERDRAGREIPVQPAMNRRDEVEEPSGAPESPGVDAEVRALFGRLSGFNLAEAGSRVSFLELGFDSLLLTQAAQGIEKQFGVRVSLAQLMAKLSNFELLSAHIEKSSPRTETSAAARGNGASRTAGSQVEFAGTAREP